MRRHSCPMPLSFPTNWDSAEVVGQVGNLRRVGNPPEPIVNRPAGAGCRGTLWVARRIPSCPTMNAGCSASRKLSDIGQECATSAVDCAATDRDTARPPTKFDSRKSLTPRRRLPQRFFDRRRRARPMHKSPVPKSMQVAGSGTVSKLRAPIWPVQPVSWRNVPTPPAPPSV